MKQPHGFPYREWDTDPNSGRDFGFKGTRGRAVPSRALQTIHPLSEEYARQLWHWLFASKKEVIPLLEKTCWVWKVRAKEARLEDTWNEADVQAFVRWLDEEPVFFLGRAGYGFETTWEVFRHYWEHFVDSTWEDGVLFHPTKREVAVFFEGWVGFGRRSKRRLAMRPAERADN